MRKLCSVLFAFYLCIIATSLEAQVFDPVLWWRFECDPQPMATPFAGQDFALDGVQHDANWPGNGNVAWINQYRRGGPMGNFFNVETNGVPPEIERVSFSTAPAGTPGTNGDWPETQNPDGMTVELIARINECTGSVVPIYIQDQLVFRISANFLLLTYFTECDGPTTHTVPLNGMGRLHSAYYRDQEWHHYAIRYAFDPQVGTGNIAIYIDGATLPELTFPLTSRMAYEGISSFNVGSPAGTGGNRYSLDVDEAAVCDYALDPLLIQQHWLDLDGGAANYSQTTTLTNPLIPPTFNNLQRDPEEFAYGFDPNNPPVSYDPNSMNTFEEQLQRLPVPRYPYNRNVPRNNMFPGDDGSLAEKIDNQTLSHFQDVVDVVTELYDHFNYNFHLGNTNEAQEFDPSDATPLFCEALVAKASTIANVRTSLITAWGGVRDYQIPSTMTFIPNINRTDLPNNNYMENAAGPLGFIRNQPPASALCQSATVTNNQFLAWDMPLGTGSAPELDGLFQNAILSNLEGAQGLNQEVDFILENGEVAPFLMGTNAFNTIISGSGTIDCPATNTNIHEQSVDLDYNTPTTNWSNEPEYIAFRKTGIRQQYLDGLVNYAPNNRSFSWYDVGGDSPFEFSRAINVNNMFSMFGNNTGQTSYPTPYFYPARMHTWFDNFTDDAGIRRIVLARQEELDPVHNGDFDFFAPAVSPGYDEGDLDYSSTADELDMIRPGQYLGLMKHLSILGADYFNAFQLQVNTPGMDRPHHSSWWGWQYVSPSYAQAASQRVADLYYNSTLLEGDNGLYFADGVLGSQDHYRFWAGSPHFLVGARQGNGGLANQYLISGSIMPYLSENHYDPAYPASHLLEDLAEVELVPGTKMTFPIRRQGSMYFYDLNPAMSQVGPVFYQLDSWHEYSHPERWTNDIFIQAEVFDNQDINVPTDEFIIETLGNDWGPVNDGQFPYFTSYIRGDNLIPNASPEIEYSFNTREFNDQDDMNVAIRARNLVGNMGRTIFHVEITPADNTGNQLWFRDVVIQPGATCWQWYDVGRFEIPTDLPTHDDDYLLRIIPQTGNLAIDEIRMVTDLTWLVYNNTGFFSAPTGPSVTLSLPATGCENDLLQCNATFNTGTPPWSIDVEVTYPTGTGNIFTFEHIYNNSFDFTLPTDGPGATNVSITALRDHDCGGGIIFNPSPTITVNPVPTIGVNLSAPVPTCPANPPTLTAIGGGTFQWHLQGIPIQGATTNTFLANREGIYAAEVTNGGCRDTSECIRVEFTTPELQFSNTVTNPPIICAPGNIAVELFPNGFGFAGGTWTVQPATNPVPIPNFQGGWDISAPGVYTLTSFDPNACMATDEITVLGLDITTTPIGYQCEGENIDIVLDDHVSIQGGAWTGTGVSQLNTGEWVFNPSQAPSSGIYTLNYQLQTCSGCSPLNADLVVTVDRCCVQNCQPEDPDYVLEERFDYLPCPTSVPFTSSLVLSCGSLTAGQYDITPNSTGLTPQPASDHTGLTGSSFMAAQTFAGGGTSTLYKITAQLEAGKNYTFAFWVDNLSTASGNINAALDYTISLPTPITQNLTINNANGWEEICTTFVSPITGPVSISISSPEKPDLFWGLDDIRVEESEPDFTLTGPTYSLCPGSAVFLTHSALPAGYSISFTPAGGSWFNNSAALRTWVPFPNPPSGQTTTYTATVTDGTCTSTQSVDVIVQSTCPCKNCPEGLLAEQIREIQIPSSENEPLSPLSVYPNPTSGTVTLSGEVEAGNLDFQLVSVLGEVITEKQVTSTGGLFESQIDLQNVSAGVYYLVVRMPGGTQAFRVVKQ